MLDEVQFVENFEMVLNSLLHIENMDVYVRGKLTSRKTAVFARF